MRKMPEELFYGNINPNDHRFIRGTEFDKAMRTLSGNEDKLTELLNGKEKGLFLDLVNAHSKTAVDFLSAAVFACMFNRCFPILYKISAYSARQSNTAS